MADDPFVAGIRSALEGATGRLVARKMRLRQPRPAPPRGVKKISVASGNEIVWEEPPPGTVFSHYCIRVDTDAGPPAMRVPASTTRQIFLSGTNYFVSTCLDSTGMESPGVKAG